jgi:hypothetical protein
MSDAARTVDELRATYGDLLTRAPATGDPDGEACAAIDEAAERLRGRRAEAAQIALWNRDDWATLYFGRAPTR